jgi:hypothetical protein
MRSFRSPIRSIGRPKPESLRSYNPGDRRRTKKSLLLAMSIASQCSLLANATSGTKPSIVEEIPEFKLSHAFNGTAYVDSDH